MRYTLLAVMLFAFQLKGANETSILIPLPEATQKQLADLITPAIEQLKEVADCKFGRAIVIVTGQPIALKVMPVCELEVQDEKMQLLHTRNN